VSLLLKTFRWQLENLISAVVVHWGVDSYSDRDEDG
jgi:hypothetical protein